MNVNERVLSLLLCDKLIMSNSIQRLVIYTDKVIRVNVKTLKSHEVIDQVVKAEETVAHDEELHLIQIKLAAWTLISTYTDYKQSVNWMWRTSDNKNARFSAAWSVERWLRHRDISKQVHTDALMIATQVNDYRKGEVVKKLSQAIQCNWLVKIKRRMQVQYQVEQKNNSMHDNNNDRNAKPEWGTERKEKESIDRFAFITERTCKGL